MYSSRVHNVNDFISGFWINNWCTKYLLKYRIVPIVIIRRLFPYEQLPDSIINNKVKYKKS